MGGTLNPYVEGQGPIPQVAWYTDGSCHGQPLTWAAMALQLSTEIFWHETGAGQSSQWAELGTVSLVLMNETGPVHICTDSWAVYQGLTLWLPWWAAQEWMIDHLWGQGPDLWKQDLQQGAIIYHVPGHRPL
ncbi:ribonuclease H-like [Pteropus medius]|uniref:ribonuclease H-like n=1 Tax=Pteropus vampyrus TaxID=132908 RepID=UPI00196A5636|nr:ribonuclease H-like [Pteropus giganteus]